MLSQDLTPKYVKLRDREHDIVVVERNRPDDTFGWGVVLSDETLENLAANDPVSADSIRREFAYWDDISVYFKGMRTVSTGHGFCGIGRMKLLDILQHRAVELGVELRFEQQVDSVSEFVDFDVIVAADGLNSGTRSEFNEAFQPDIDVRKNKFVWMGTRQKFDDAFTFIFESTEHGWIWAHAYQFDSDTATFIVGCSEDTFDHFGFGEMSQEQSLRTCESVFAARLGGHSLMSNANHLRGSAWLNFPRVLCNKWSHKNIVLIGDAAATAYRVMLQAMDDGADLSSLRLVVSAGEALPVPIFEEWVAKTGIPILDGIGATELLHIFISNKSGAAEAGSTGSVVPGYEAKVMDDDMNEVAVGEVGNLAVRGPTGCRYLADDRQKKYVRRGWNLTGDAFSVDEVGRYHFAARSDDMIVSSGYNIAGPEVEAALLAHEDVMECAVIGVDDEERGQIVQAHVVLKGGVAVDTDCIKYLQDHVKATIAPYKYPRSIVFADALPKTQTGKLQRFKLRETRVDRGMGTVSSAGGAPPHPNPPKGKGS